MDAFPDEEFRNDHSALGRPRKSVNVHHHLALQQGHHLLIAGTIRPSDDDCEIASD
jgi:hypothetical protein